MIIFESILTTFIASEIFRGPCGSKENWLELKIEPIWANLACLNRWNILSFLFKCVGGGNYPLGRCLELSSTNTVKAFKEMKKIFFRYVQFI
jgi:hypothetical protein